jgi:hypothetical protein
MKPMQPIAQSGSRLQDGFPMLPRYFLPLSLLAGSASAVAVSACGGSGALNPPISDGQYDDPDDPGSGGSQTGPAPPIDAGAAPVALPGGTAGIGFDDMRFSGDLSTLLVPGGRSGDLDFVDPSAEGVTSVPGFSMSATYTGDSSFGVTSADEGNGIVYATDRTSQMLYFVDPGQKAIVASVGVAATPGYVRYVSPTNEVWITEPDQAQIEIFTLPSSEKTAPSHAAFISVPGGPQSLEIDATLGADGGGSGVAYTQTATNTVAIDVLTRTVTGQWTNGCMMSEGLAVDPTNGWVMSACAEGKVFVLNTQGTTLGSVSVLAGVGQVTYDPQRQRLYVPSAMSSAIGVVSLGNNGIPQLLGSVSTAGCGGCAVTAGGGAVYVCAPSQGDLLFVHDPF